MTKASTAVLLTCLMFAAPLRADKLIDNLVEEVAQPKPDAAQIAAQQVAKLRNIDGFDWMQASAQEKDAAEGVLEGRPDLASIVGTTLPKATANLAAFSREYVIDLKKFNIFNDGTHPAETSKGINEALAFAKSSGANRVVFPSGVYLISENEPIDFTLKDTIVDLNQAVLQLNTNALIKSTLATISHGAENFRLTNGELRGDRDTHDYKTNPGTHEHCMVLTVRGGKNLEIDHLTISNTPGSGVSTRLVVSGLPGQALARTVSVKDIEPGEFSDSGVRQKSDRKLVTNKPFDLSSFSQFEFGYTLGYQGYPSVRGGAYQAYFYDENQRFLEKRPCLQYRKTTVPAGAKFVQLEFNQRELGKAVEGIVGRITDVVQPTDVHFHHNKLVRNRTLGLAFCGGQKWVIEENLFEDNGPQPPGYGVDFEDGWDLMQEVVFRRNKFKGNRAGDLVVCAGTEMIFEENEFEKNAVFYSRTNNYRVANNKFNGLALYRTGIKHAAIRDNQYSNGRLEVAWNERGWAGVPPMTLKGETIDNLRAINGGHIVLEGCKISKTTIVTNKDSRLIHLKNCDITDCSIEVSEKGPPVAVILENCRITLTDRGLIQFAKEKAALIRLVGNTIENRSQQPLLTVLSTGYTQADARLVMENNKITQASGAALIDGNEMGKGVMEVVLTGNTTDKPWLTDKFRAAAWVKVREAKP